MSGYEKYDPNTMGPLDGGDGDMDGVYPGMDGGMDGGYPGMDGGMNGGYGGIDGGMGGGYGGMDGGTGGGYGGMGGGMDEEPDLGHDIIDPFKNYDETRGKRPPPKDMPDFPDFALHFTKNINIPPKKPLIHLIPRDEWGAVPAKSETAMKLPLKHIRYNQTMTDNCIGKEDCIKIVKDLQKEHMDKGMPDIKYNFLIGGDGTVYEGRGWNNKPEIHAALSNKDYYDVAYIGKYGDNFPNWEQNVTGTKFIKFALENEYMERGHGVTNVMEISD